MDEGQSGLRPSGGALLPAIHTATAVQVDNKDVLNCYYTHSDDTDALQVLPRNIVSSSAARKL